jgi:hypothetical protein
MSFEQIILDELAPFITKYDLLVTEAKQTTVIFLSSNRYIDFRVSHNPYENAYSLSVGKSGPVISTIEIDNEALHSFFGSALKLSQVPLRVFNENLVAFFTHEGSPLLKGDKNLFGKLQEFADRRNHLYHEQIKLNQADIAWASKNYRDFIDIMSEIDLVMLPKSYILKRNYAKKKLQGSG